METDTLTENVMRRVRAYRDDGDPSPAHEPDALAEATALLQASGEHGEQSMKGLHAVAALHWVRYLSLPYDRRADDLTTAQRLFRTVADHDPSVVPTALLKEFGIQDDGSVAKIESVLSALREAVLTENPDTLQPLITLSLEVLRETPAIRARHRDLWAMVAMAYRVQFRQTWSLDLLDPMVDAARHAAAFPNLPNHAAALDILAIVLKDRYDRTSVADDADYLIDTIRQRLDLLAPDDDGDNLTRRLFVIAEVFTRWLDRADQPVTVGDDDLELLRKAAQMSRVGDQDRPLRLAAAGRALRIRFEDVATGTLIDESVDALRQSVIEAPFEHPRRPRHLAELAVSLRMRYASLGNRADLDEAINALRACVQTIRPDALLMQTGANPPTLPEMQYRLADALNARANGVADLDEATAALGAALTVTAPGPATGLGRPSRDDMERLWAALHERRLRGR